MSGGKGRIIHNQLRKQKHAFFYSFGGVRCDYFMQVRTTLFLLRAQKSKMQQGVLKSENHSIRMKMILHSVLVIPFLAYIR